MRNNRFTYYLFITLLLISLIYRTSEAKKDVIIGFVPLDDRPVCYKSVKDVANIFPVKLLTPPPSATGFYGIHGNPEQLMEWLKKVAKEARYLLLSIDMLCYGGLVASRADKTPLEVALKRLRFIKELKKNSPSLKIYAFNVIQRLAPTYTGDDKKNKLNDILVSYLKIKYKEEKTPDDLKRLEEINKKLPEEFLKTYLEIRKRNHSINMEALKLVSEGIIEYLILPLDDTAKVGPHIIEVKAIEEFIREFNLITKVFIYPGTDEIGLELLAKVVTEIAKKKPRFFIRYSATGGPYLTQPLEDRTLGEVIKAHVITSGGIIVDTPEQADIILFVNCVGELPYKWDSAERNLVEFVEAIKYYLEKKKFVAIADIATLNKADTDLINILLDKIELPSLTAYAGWNTASNSLGCAISQAIIYFCSKRDIKAKLANIEFLFQRFADEFLYATKVKPVVDKKVREYGTHPLYITKNYVEIKNFLQQELMKVAEELFEKHFKGYPLGKHKIIKDMVLKIGIPWLRTFEVVIDVKFLL